MTETSKIRSLAEKYCQGCGIDLGCGTEEKIVKEAFGIDNRESPNVNLKMFVEDLSVINTGSLDYVFSSHFIEHLEKPMKMIHDIARVLRTGGYGVFYLPDRFLYTEPNPEHLHMWTLEEFKKMFPDSFNVVEEVDKYADYSFFVVVQKQ